MSSRPLHCRRACRFCGPYADPVQVIANLPGVDGSAWSARSVVHPHALYHIEGEPARRADGLYDRMGSVGAHEVLIENPRHDGNIWNASDLEVEQFLRLAAMRLQDLKRDSRFKYISIFKNHGERRRTGIRTSHFPADRDHVCAAPRPLRTPRRTRLFRNERALRLLRHYSRRRSVRMCAW